MLTQPLLDKLTQLRLSAFRAALEEQLHNPQYADLPFEDRLGLLVDRELTERQDRRLKTRLRQARLKHNACVEDLDYRAPRGLDKALMLQLATCRWVHEGLNLIINGPTGVGKTWIACALAQKACREGYSALYLRLPRLFEDLSLAHGDGRFTKLMAGFAKTDLIILDDWGLASLDAAARCDLLELLDDRRLGFPSVKVDVDFRETLAFGDVARVEINGRRFPPLLWPPYVRDVTAGLKAGPNTIRVRVTNTLANRHGDPKPSGLLGPVSLEPRHATRVELSDWR